MEKWEQSDDINTIAARVEEGQPVTPVQEVQFSRYFEDDYMTNAINLNKKLIEEEKKSGTKKSFVTMRSLTEAQTVRKKVQKKLNDPDLADALRLPEDNVGNTFIEDSSYGGSEEPTTVCPRSLAAQALLDEIAKDLGRPLTVRDTLVISEQMMKYLEKPE